ncbi:hypothetical protein RR45_GL001441 [Lactococcus chungangensis CAU 28 = DSM 22330]|uniref:Uncharacterized protein n=1 Tax=Pseudolactococcus chungangensis CAU 28 = DSM 22330 TaxID=1122154 RepID=A0ABX4I4I0_9LACT|nr:hypothetical protein RR45_GL001441 [Lactococcus chungangensis CAU 28 = DSM 22330]
MSTSYPIQKQVTSIRDLLFCTSYNKKLKFINKNFDETD